MRTVFGERKRCIFFCFEWKFFVWFRSKEELLLTTLEPYKLLYNVYFLFRTPNFRVFPSDSSRAAEDMDAEAFGRALKEQLASLQAEWSGAEWEGDGWVDGWRNDMATWVAFWRWESHPTKVWKMLVELGLSCGCFLKDRLFLVGFLGSKGFVQGTGASAWLLAGAQQRGPHECHHRGAQHSDPPSVHELCPLGG